MLDALIGAAILAAFVAAHLYMVRVLIADSMREPTEQKESGS